jgi:dihydroorotate dehydrogenase (fumarate)
MAIMRTRWLGFDLPHPLVVGSSPLADTLEGAERLEEAGAAAIILRSLFEEQSRPDFEPHEAAMSAQDYVAHVARLKRSIRIPVIASMNGTAPGPWMEQARALEAAGADALELNLYTIATEPWDPPQVIERRTESVVRAIRAMTRIPLNVKISPHYTSLPYMAQLLGEAGADGLTLFNRFYQPDLDLEKGAVTRCTRLSDSSELLPRLHAAAVLFGRIKTEMSITGGVHTHIDVLKAIACGAHVAQLVSALLKEGPRQLARIREDMDAWLERHNVGTLDEFRGTMSLLRCPDPSAWERNHYIRVLRGHETDYVIR